jgi:formate dehydrogenase maturation protein FdhE
VTAGGSSVTAASVPSASEPRKTWSVCPVCGGRGLVMASFYPDLASGADGGGYVKCRSCQGQGVLAA